MKHNAVLCKNTKLKTKSVSYIYIQFLTILFVIINDNLCETRNMKKLHNNAAYDNNVAGVKYKFVFENL